MHLLVGPPASGKTGRLLERAQSYLALRKRVWWVCLPAQKAYVYRRATQRGALLGLEVLSSQQLYYRLLAASYRLKPILTGPARVALVGEALTKDGQRVGPGEARLFARAIAEAKRNGVRPEELPVANPEARRLQQVYTRYEELKENWGRWDYDDFRLRALELLEKGTVEVEPDLVVVDGFRELSPLELRLLQALSRQTSVWVGLPEAPPGFAPHEVLTPRGVSTQTYRAANPVSEARWVLRAIKRDLAQGLHPLDLAVVAPASRIPALLTLADEYGLPLIDHLPRTAADTPEGRRLLELLELPDYPTPSRLMAIPELAPLGRAALERGLVGLEATTRLAAELGMQELWTAWLARLAPPEGYGGLLAWAEELLDALPEVRHSPRRARLLERAYEAQRIAVGPDFRHWWAALLAETYEPHRPPGGVAVLTPNLASGQRWKKLYLTYAVEGAYSTGEEEDYFIPEEWRGRPLEAGLPRRFLGRDRRMLQELKTRADEVVITYPEAGQEGPLEPEPALVGGLLPPRLPELPAASRLELAQNGGYRPPFGQLRLGTPLVEDLRHYRECGFQFWAQQFTGDEGSLEWWQHWIRELRKAGKLVPARLEALAQQFPQTEGWMRYHYALLSELELGFVLQVKSTDLRARLDGVLRKGNEAHIYRFVAPETPPEEASKQVRDRWSERWAAAYLLSAFPGRIRQVSLWAWPVLGQPVRVYDKPIGWLGKPLKDLLADVQQAYAQYKTGAVEPRPGYRCLRCAVRDACREAQYG